MSARKFSIATAVAAALLAPALSMADSPWVPANNERGYNYQPDHGSTAVGAQGRSAGTAAAPGVLLREGPPLDTFPSSAGGKTQPDPGSTAIGAQGRSAGTAVAPGVLLREGPPLDTFPSSAEGKTREEVRNELLNMSPAERQRLRELYRN